MGSVKEDIADKLVHWKDDICRMVENECKTTANSPATTTDQILSLVCKRIEGAENPYPITRYYDPRYLDKPVHDAFENARQLFLGVLKEE